MKKKIVMLFSLILMFSLGLTNVNAKTVTVKSIDNVANYADYGYAASGTNYNTRKISITDNEGNTANAICVAPMQKAPDVGDSSSNVVEITDRTFINILYYGEFGHSSVNYAREVYYKSHENAYNSNGQLILTHVALSKQYASIIGSDKYGWSYEANDTLIRDANSYIETVRNLETPTNVKAYAVIPADSNKQIYAYLEVQKSGTLVINKSSSNPSQTSNSENYSLSGAIYMVYADQALTNMVGILTTNDQGVTNSLSLNAGTYYIKEKTAPKGFELDPKVYTATVESGKTYTLRVEDKPEVKKGKLSLKKTSDTSTTRSLAGAIYMVYADQELTVLMGVLTTDENGNTNEIELDAGTYYVKEKTAPEGFEVDTEVHVANVIAGESGVVSVTDRVIPEPTPTPEPAPDVPENPQTGIGGYLISTVGISGVSGGLLYFLKKRNYVFKF